MVDGNNPLPGSQQESPKKENNPFSEQDKHGDETATAGPGIRRGLSRWPARKAPGSGS
jgi:hypothetical protein